MSFRHLVLNSILTANEGSGLRSVTAVVRERSALSLQPGNNLSSALMHGTWCVGLRLAVLQIHIRCMGPSWHGCASAYLSGVVRI